VNMSCTMAQSVQCAADLYKSSTEVVWDLRNQASQNAWLTLAAKSGATFSSSAENSQTQAPFFQWNPLPDFGEFEITFSNFAGSGVVELSLNGVVVGVAEARIAGRLPTTVRMSYASGSILRLTGRNSGNLSSNILLLLFLGVCNVCPTNTISPEGSEQKVDCVCKAGFIGGEDVVWDLRNQPSKEAWLSLAATSGATMSSSAENSQTQERWMEWNPLPDFQEFEITFSNFAELGVVELSLNGVVVGVSEARNPERPLTTVRMSYVAGSVLKLTARNWGDLSSNIVLRLYSSSCTACEPGKYK